MTVAALALLLLSPVMAAVALMARARMGSPVLFKQKRPGLHGASFTILKFRTMTDLRGSDGQMRPDSERLGAFGQFLRSSSADELPELVNVLRGEMSLVGPRPLLMEYLELYTAEQMRRHQVRPGITGWAQVNGRNAQSWDERFALDCWYVDHYTFFLDLKILLLTAWRIVRREGIRKQGHATMPRFAGSSQSGSRQASKRTEF